MCKYSLDFTYAMQHRQSAAFCKLSSRLFVGIISIHTQPRALFTDYDIEGAELLLLVGKRKKVVTKKCYDEDKVAIYF